MAKTPSAESNFKCNATKKELQDLCREHGLSPYKTKASLLKSLRHYYKETGMAKSPTSKVIYDTNLTKKELQKLCRKYGLSPYDTKVNLVSSLRTYFQVSDFENVEKVGCSMSNIQKHSSSKKQENTCSQNLAQSCANNFRYWNSQQISAGMNNFASAEDDGVGSIAGLQHIDSASTMDDAVLSPLKSSTSVPSLEFCVRSEEGINLFVDLNSSLPNCSKRLENELSTCQDLHKDKFQRFHQELKGSFMCNVDSGFRISSYCAHADPSPHSFARKTIKSKIDCPDADDELTNSMPVYRSATVPGIKSCSENEETETKNSSSSVFHASPIKLDCNSVVSVVSNGLLNTRENQNMKLGRVKCHENLKEFVVPCSISTAIGTVEMQLSGVAIHRQNMSYSTVVNDDSLGSVVVDVVETGNIGLANTIEVHNASSDYVPTTADELKGSDPDRSKASQTLKKRLEDSVSGRGHKRKRNDGLYQEGYHQHGRILRSANRLGQKVLPRRSMRLVSKPNSKFLVLVSCHISHVAVQIVKVYFKASQRKYLVSTKGEWKRLENMQHRLALTSPILLKTKRRRIG
ncbi:uncharacterized protein Fot_22668 [Forsythia ovata]|uniref:SAP domain-containing protein n=1 Tax=Forsythia ovata TaxID=205694 RepID=A0ABD1UYE1_9LAMI